MKSNASSGVSITALVILALLAIVVQLLPLVNGGPVAFIIVDGTHGNDTLTCGGVNAPCKSIGGGYAAYMGSKFIGNDLVIQVEQGEYSGLDNCGLHLSLLSAQIVGSGPHGSVIFRCYGSYGWVLNARTLLIDNFNFRDMEHYGISILSATTVTVSNCQFHNSTRSLEIKGVPQQVNVRHCDFSALRAAQDVSAFYVTVQGDITVEDCTFRNNVITVPFAFNGMLTRILSTQLVLARRLVYLGTLAAQSGSGSLIWIQGTRAQVSDLTFDDLVEPPLQDIPPAHDRQQRGIWDPPLRSFEPVIILQLTGPTNALLAALVDVSIRTNHFYDNGVMLLSLEGYPTSGSASLQRCRFHHSMVLQSRCAIRSQVPLTVIMSEFDHLTVAHSMFCADGHGFRMALSHVHDNILQLGATVFNITGIQPAEVQLKIEDNTFTNNTGIEAVLFDMRQLAVSKCNFTGNRLEASITKLPFLRLWGTSNMAPNALTIRDNEGDIVVMQELVLSVLSNNRGKLILAAGAMLSQSLVTASVANPPVYCPCGTCTIDSCQFTNNTNPESGGALIIGDQTLPPYPSFVCDLHQASLTRDAATDVAVTITSSSFVGNVAKTDGSAVVTHTNTTFSQCVFIDNRALKGTPGFLGAIMLGRTWIRELPAKCSADRTQASLNNITVQLVACDTRNQPEPPSGGVVQPPTISFSPYKEVAISFRASDYCGTPMSNSDWPERFTASLLGEPTIPVSVLAQTDNPGFYWATASIPYVGAYEMEIRVASVELFYSPADLLVATTFWFVNASSTYNKDNCGAWPETACSTFSDLDRKANEEDTILVAPGNYTIAANNQLVLKQGMVLDVLGPSTWNYSSTASRSVPSEGGAGNNSWGSGGAVNIECIGSAGTVFIANTNASISKMTFHSCVSQYFRICGSGVAFERCEFINFRTPQGQDSSSSLIYVSNDQSCVPPSSGPEPRPPTKFVSCIFRDNDLGANSPLIWVKSGSLTIIQSLFESNRGQLLRLPSNERDAELMIVRSEFVRNSEQLGGPIVELNSVARMELHDTVWTNNTSILGAMSLIGGTRLLMSRCTFVNNHATKGPAVLTLTDRVGLPSEGTSTVTISRCDFANNSGFGCAGVLDLPLVRLRVQRSNFVANLLVADTTTTSTTTAAAAAAVAAANCTDTRHAIVLASSDASLVGCLFDSNSVASASANHSHVSAIVVATVLDASAQFLAIKCRFTGNTVTAARGAGAIAILRLDSIDSGIPTHDAVVISHSSFDAQHASFPLNGTSEPGEAFPGSRVLSGAILLDQLNTNTNTNATATNSSSSSSASFSVHQGHAGLAQASSIATGSTTPWNALIDNCDFTRNTAELGGGGAICNRSPWTLIVNASLFMSNSAGNAGALLVASSLANQVLESHFSNNSAMAQAGIGGSIMVWPQTAATWQFGDVVQCTRQSPYQMRVMSLDASVGVSLESVGFLDELASPAQVQVVRSPPPTSESAPFVAGTAPQYYVTLFDLCQTPLQANQSAWHQIECSVSPLPGAFNISASLVPFNDTTLQVRMEPEPTLAAEYNLVIRYLGRQILYTDSFRVVPSAPVANMSFASGQSYTDVVLYCREQYVEFNLTAVDAYGNVNYDGTAEFFVTIQLLSPPKCLSLTEPQVYLLDSGLYLVNYTVHSCASAPPPTIHFLTDIRFGNANGTSISNSPSNSSLLASPLAKAAISIAPPTVQANQSSVVLLALVSAEEQPVSCSLVFPCLSASIFACSSAVCDPQPTTIETELVCVTDGIFSVAFTTTQSGTYLGFINYPVPGNYIGSWPATFNAAPASANNSIVTFPSYAIFNQSNQVKVSAIDQYSNQCSCVICADNLIRGEVHWSGGELELAFECITPLWVASFLPVALEPVAIYVYINGARVPNAPAIIPVYSAPQCVPGFFNPESGEDPCTACAIGTFSNVTAAKSCEPCGPGRTTLESGSSSSTACVCDAGFHGPTCQPCPRTALGEKEICEKNNTCKVGRTGDICTLCSKPGYLPLLGYCHACPTIGIAVLELIAYGLFVLVLVLLVSYNRSDSEGLNAFVVGLDAIKWIALAPIIKTIDWPYASMILFIVSSAWLLNPQLWPTPCLGFPVWVLWLSFVLLPLLLQPVLLAKNVVVAIYRAYLRWSRPPTGQLLAEYISDHDSGLTESDDALSSTIGSHIKDGIFSRNTLREQLLSTILFVNFLYFPITLTVAIPFNCSLLYASDWLYEFPEALTCGSDEWWKLLPLYSVLAFVYVVLVPVWTIGAMWRSRNAPFESIFASIVIVYRSSAYYWHAVRLLRDLLLALIYVVMPPSLQLVALICLMLGLLVGTVLIQPYRIRVLNVLEALQQACMLVFYAVVYGFHFHPGYTSDIASLIVSFSATTICSLAVLIIIKPHVTSWLQDHWNALVNQSSRFSFSPMKALIADDVFQSWRIKPSDIQLIHPPIAKGATGVVYKAVYKGAVVAVKTLILDSGESRAALREEFKREIQNLCRLHHPNVTLLIGACLENLSMVVEFVARGSFYDVLHRNSPELTWTRKLNILIGSACGMTYLHEQIPPMLHRDLKSLNILVSEAWEGKVADFGGSKRTALVDQSLLTKKHIGTTRWAAPELLNNEDYDEKIDVYSFALIMWEAVTHMVPWHELQWESEVANRVASGDRPAIPDHCPKRFRALIRKCWQQDPHKRPSFPRILEYLRSMIPVFAELDEADRSSISTLELNGEPSPRAGTDSSEPLSISDYHLINPDESNHILVGSLELSDDELMLDASPPRHDAATGADGIGVHGDDEEEE